MDSSHATDPSNRTNHSQASAVSSTNLMNLTAPSNMTNSILYVTSISISFYTVSLVQVVECPPTYLCVDSNKNSCYIQSALLNISLCLPDIKLPLPRPQPLLKWNQPTGVEARTGSAKMIRVVLEGNKYKAALVQVVE